MVYYQLSDQLFTPDELGTVGKENTAAVICTLYQSIELILFLCLICSSCLYTFHCGWSHQSWYAKLYAKFVTRAGGTLSDSVNETRFSGHQWPHVVVINGHLDRSVLRAPTHSQATVLDHPSANEGDLHSRQYVARASLSCPRGGGL